MAAIPVKDVRGLGLTYLATDYVADLHQVVVHHVRQVVGRKSVRLHNNLIIHILIIKDHLAPNNVFDFSFAVGHFHADHVALAIGNALFDNLTGELKACPVVGGLRVLCTTELNAHLLKSFLRAETAIGIAGLE